MVTKPKYRHLRTKSALKPINIYAIVDQAGVGQCMLFGYIASWNKHKFF